MEMGEHDALVVIRSSDLVRHECMNGAVAYDWVSGWWELSCDNSPNWLSRNPEHSEESCFEISA